MAGFVVEVRLSPPFPGVVAPPGGAGVGDKDSNQ